MQRYKGDLCRKREENGAGDEDSLFMIIKQEV